jgi:MFS family permease
MIVIVVAGGLRDVVLKPSLSDLPGSGTLQSLVNGLGAWALVAALVGLVIGAAAWALGVHSQNFQQSMVGRRAVLVSALAALLIGAAPTVVNFFFGQGTHLH